MLIRWEGYKSPRGPDKPPTLVPGCEEGGQRPSGLEAWEILGDPTPGKAERDVVRVGHAMHVPPGPGGSPERGLAGPLSPPGGRPQSASGDRGELSSKDSGRLWMGWERGIMITIIVIITTYYAASNWDTAP